MQAKAEYVPGVCNIGNAEIRRRRQAGWLGLGVTVVLWTAFFLFRVPAPWRLFLFLPAMIGATGFLQAGMRFCAGFGMRGEFNFGAEVGKTESVEQAEFRRKDKRTARSIGLLSALGGLVVAAAGFFLVVPA